MVEAVEAASEDEVEASVVAVAEVEALVAEEAVAVVSAAAEAGLLAADKHHPSSPTQ